jgi:hypothetical protein
MVLSTTKPVETISAISEKLLRLKPNAEGAEQRQRHADRGHQCRLEIAQEDENHQDHQHGREDQADLDIVNGVADRSGGVEQNALVDADGQRLFEFGKLLLDPVHHLDDIGAGLLGDLHQDGGLAVEGAEVADILNPVIDLGHVLQANRRIVAVGDDQGLIVLGQAGIVIGIDLEALALLLDIALGAVGVGGADRGAHVFQSYAVFEQGAGIEFDADRGQRSAVERDIAHPGNLGQFLLDDVGSLVVDLPRRQGLGCQRQDQDRLVRGIEFSVGGIGPERRRQIDPRRVDCRLHVARRAVDIAADVELQHDLGVVDIAARGHLGDARNGTQMPFQRCRHAGGHGLRAGARYIGAYRNGGNVDIGIGRDRQHEIGHQPCQPQPQRQQSRGNAALDEDAGEIHSAGSGSGPAWPARRRSRHSRKSRPALSK